VNDTKKCTQCRLDLPLDEFYRRGSGVGLRSECKGCSKAYYVAFRQKEIEENPKYGWLKYALCDARGRARRRGIIFSLLVDDIDLPDHCPVLGMKLNYFRGGARREGGTNDSPSLDRFDPSRGYEPGNVRIISWRANKIKNNATISELRSIIKYMEEWGHQGLDSHGIIYMGCRLDYRTK
jgi:hypothetical protein